MDIVKIAGRIASSRTFAFKGTVRSAFDGENSSYEGNISFDGKTCELNAYTGGRDLTIELDGKTLDPEQDTELYNDLENFLTLNFPELDDERWEEDPDAQDADEDDDGGSDAVKMDLEASGPAWP